MSTKVFVGNLSFKTTKDELVELFKANDLEVVDTNIITRGPRSLGYGFIELQSEAEAKKAVEKLNKKDLDGRELNVEVAHPQDESKAEPKKKPRRGRAKKPASGDEAAEKKADGEKAKSKPKAKKPRAPKKEAKRFGSDTGLFIGNLPFSYKDEDLLKLFKDNGVEPASARVVIKRSGNSKGFGFVEFADTAKRDKALKAVNGKSVEERELTVKIVEKKEEEKAEN